MGRTWGIAGDLKRFHIAFQSGRTTMFSNFLVTVRSYFAFYDRYFSTQWAEMSPQKYGMLLIVVGLFGWLLMKAGNKRT